MTRPQEEQLWAAIQVGDIRELTRALHNKRKIHVNVAVLMQVAQAMQGQEKKS
jgi:hypothetical protein